MPDPQSSYTNFDDERLRAAALVLRALRHDIRQKIVHLLSGTADLTVTDLIVALKMEQSAVSQHLNILREAGIVSCKRRGKYVHYRLDRQRLTYLIDLVNKLAN